MKIEEFFSKVQSYEQLCEIAEKAEPKLSFWGKRYIVIAGYEGVLQINDITKRLFELINKNYDFSEVDRGYGKRIATRIDYIYETSNSLIKASNLFTKVLAFIRNFNLHPTPRTAWYSYFENYTFELYTRAQFTNFYGYTPENAKERGFKLGGWGCNPDRWCVITSPPPRGFFSSWVTS